MHRRRQKKWHWGWITLIVAAVQLTALLAVQGGEAAENWQNLLTVREESVEEVSATEEKNEVFRLSQNLYVYSDRRTGGDGGICVPYIRSKHYRALRIFEKCICMIQSILYLIRSF